MGSSPKKYNKAEIEWQKFLKSPAVVGLSTYEIWSKHRRELFKKYGNLPTSEYQNNELRKFKNKYKGERIFIVGNGPSLNKIDFSLLQKEYTFGVNRINLLYKRTSWRPTFYTVNDWEVGPDNAHELESHPPETTLFIPRRFDGMPGTERAVIYASIHSNSDKDFAWDIEKGIYMAGTVLAIPIQISVYMGFDPIYLIGVDVSYKVLPDVKQSGKVIKENNIRQFLESKKDNDPNHFDPSYFGKGKKWHNPNPEKMIDGFTNIFEIMRNNRRELINATIGGNLNSIPRVNFLSLFQSADKNKNIKLCVIVPAYNAEAYLDMCIKSVLKQMEGDLKLVIVDDGSTDETLSIAESYDCSNITVIHQTNQGRGKARNTGLKKAFEFNPEYIAFLDADDIFLEKGLNKLVNFLDKNPGADVVSGAGIRIDQNGITLRQKKTKNRSLKLEKFLNGPPVWLTASLYRNTQSFRKIEFQEVAAGEDWLYLVDVAIQSEKWHEIPTLVTGYRATEQAKSKTSYRYACNMLKTYRIIKNRIRAYANFSQDKISASDIEQIVKVTSRLIACGQPIVAKAIFDENILNVNVSKIKAIEVKKRTKIWLEHLNIGSPQLMDNLSQPIFQKYFNKNDYLNYSLEDNVRINENRACYNWIKEKMEAGTMIDVGAHFGHTCRPYLEIKWNVLAFEPDRGKHEDLQIMQNNFTNFIWDKRAISDVESNAAFNIAKGKHGISSLLSFHVDHRQEYKVKTVTLKKAIKEHNIKNCDVLKIDIEGYELPALRGFPWETHQPSLIISEFDDHKTKHLNYSVHDQVHYLESKGYNVYISEWHPIQDYGTKHKFRAFYSAENLGWLQERAWGNIIAILNEKIDREFINLMDESVRDN